jgi:hypothetical protein
MGSLILIFPFSGMSLISLNSNSNTPSSDPITLFKLVILAVMNLCGSKLVTSPAMDSLTDPLADYRMTLIENGLDTEGGLMKLPRATCKNVTSDS